MNWLMSSKGRDRTWIEPRNDYREDMRDGDSVFEAPMANGETDLGNPGPQTSYGENGLAK